MGFLQDTQIRLHYIFERKAERVRHIKEYDFTREKLSAIMEECEGKLQKASTAEEFLRNTAPDYVKILSKLHYDVPLFLPFHAFLYIATRLLKPNVVIETGVERGGSTYVFLDALKKNGHGTLHSIDRTPRRMKFMGFDVAPVVPRELLQFMRENDRFHHHDGMSTYILPDLVKDNTVDLFVAGSHHGYDNQSFEVKTAWPAVAENGICIVDRPDYEGNEYRAWNEFIEQFKPRFHDVMPESYDSLSYTFGVMYK